MNKQDLINNMMKRISELDDDKFESISKKNYHNAGICYSKIEEIRFWIEVIKNLPNELQSVGNNECTQEVCEKCGTKFIPHLVKPLTICDKCADSILTN